MNISININFGYNYRIINQLIHRNMMVISFQKQLILALRTTADKIIYNVIEHEQLEAIAVILLLSNQLICHVLFVFLISTVLNGCACKNGATCLITKGPAYICRCPNNYSGEFCEEFMERSK